MANVQPVFSGIGPIVFGIALLCAVRLLGQPGEEGVRDPLRRALTILAWVLIAVGMFGGFLLLSGVIIGPLGLIILAMMFQRRRKAQRTALLWALAVAAQRMMPLTPALEAFAEENGGALARRARRAANLMRAGMSLPEAIDQRPRLLPAEAVMTIRVGYQAGALAQSLRQAAESQAFQEGLWHQLTGRIMYLAFLVLFAVHVGLFVMLKIVPQYTKIFDDFGAVLPPSTTLVVTVGKIVMNSGILSLLAFGLIWFLACYAVLRYIGWTTWDLPILRRLTRRLHTVDILRALAVVAERQQPMPEGIAAIAEHYPAAWIRRRLREVLGDVQAGRPWCESLAVHGLISQADQAILQAAQRVGNLAWALRETAASSSRRLAYRLHVAVQLLFPAVIVAFAFAEAVFAIGCFMPLVTLIAHLSRTVP